MSELDLEIEKKAKEMLSSKEEAKTSNLVEINQEPLNPIKYFDEVSNAITQVEGRIVEKAVDKVNDEKIIEKHSKKLAEISDKAIEAETEKQELIVESKKADNKVQRQEIKNRLIELKTESIRLKQEQKQVLKEQKLDHKKRDKDAKWEMYKGKLQKMKYDYVPNVFVLKMLLFFDGLKSFFDGLGAVSTAIVKALKWVIIIALISFALLVVPVTREWVFNVLKIN